MANQDPPSRAITCKQPFRLEYIETHPGYRCRALVDDREVLSATGPTTEQAAWRLLTMAEVILQNPDHPKFNEVTAVFVLRRA